MNWEAAFAYLIAAIVVLGLLRFCLSIAWPRKAHDPFAQPHGWEDR